MPVLLVRVRAATLTTLTALLPRRLPLPVPARAVPERDSTPRRASAARRCPTVGSEVTVLGHELIVAERRVAIHHARAVPQLMWL